MKQDDASSVAVWVTRRKLLESDSKNFERGIFVILRTSDGGFVSGTQAMEVKTNKDFCYTASSSMMLLTSANRFIMVHSVVFEDPVFVKCETAYTLDGAAYSDRPKIFQYNVETDTMDFEHEMLNSSSATAFEEEGPFGWSTSLSYIDTGDVSTSTILIGGSFDDHDPADWS